MMFTGMMWFDNDPKRALAEKVEQAADYFFKKYGQTPDVCLVNPKMMPEGETQEGKITLRANRSVLPGHLWIGVEEKAHVDQSL